MVTAALVDSGSHPTVWDAAVADYFQVLLDHARGLPGIDLVINEARASSEAARAAAAAVAARATAAAGAQRSITGQEDRYGPGAELAQLEDSYSSDYTDLFRLYRDTLVAFIDAELFCHGWR